MALFITGLRPKRSAMKLAGNSESANAAVDADNTALLAAGDSAKTRENNGSKGCTQYSSQKVEKPPTNIARLVARKAEVPAEICPIACSTRATASLLVVCRDVIASAAVLSSDMGLDRGRREAAAWPVCAQATIRGWPNGYAADV